jgi:uncharacterized delta-60 repeat protein
MLFRPFTKNKNNHMIKQLLSLSFGILSLSFMAQDAGDFDLGFNGTGILTLGPGPVHDNINDLGLQADQKIIGFGMTIGTGSFNFDIAINRINTDGTLDTSFGTDGYFKLDYNGDSDFIYQGVVLPDGKLLACGAVTTTDPDNTDVLLLKLNADGTPDTGFGGGDGMAIEAIDIGQDYANAMVVLADGSIVIVGSTAVPGFTFTHGLIMKFTAEGAVDTSFGTNGYTIVSPNNESDVYRGVVELADGSFIAVGSSNYNFGDHAWVSKYTAQGQLNTGFATAGHYIMENAVSMATDVVLLGNNILLCGNKQGSQGDVMLFSLTAAGFVNNAFGTSGEILVNVNTLDDATDLMIADDGKIVVAGTTGTGIFTRNFLVVRLNADGTNDDTFADMGVLEYSVSTDFDVASSVIQQADGKLVIGGLRAGNDNDMVFMRLWGADSGNAVIENNTANVVSIYPNPCAENSTVKLLNTEPIKTVSAINALGQIVYAENTMGKTSVQLSGLAAGVYTIAVQSAAGVTYTERMVVSGK